VDWRAEFGRAAPLELEIGSGNGEYLVGQARAAPGRDFVGVEIKWGRVKKTLRKIGLAGVPNARVVLGDVQLELGRLFAQETVSRAHMLFPCPWPGDTEGRHRLFGGPFLQLLNSRLVAGGSAWMVTDDDELFAWVLEQVDGTGFEAAARTSGADYGTKFEHKWRAGGRRVFHRLDLVKTAHVDAPVEEDRPMRLHFLEVFDPAAFRPADVFADGLVVRFKGWLYDPVHATAMVHMVAVEDRLTQEFWIEIAPAGRRWRIAPARGCHAVMTDGVQRALDAVSIAAGGRMDGDRRPSAG